MINIKKAALYGLGILMAVTAGCSKDEGVEAVDNNRIPQVLTDNFNLSVMNTVLSRSNVRSELSLPGPYTVFAPSDAAFTKAGYSSPGAILSASQPLVARIAAYHILQGNYDLNKMPFLFNQEIRSYGGKLYVTRWIKDNDTVLTINGSRLLSQGIKASNGYVQVIDRMLEPYIHETLADAIASEATLTLFHQAVQRAGLSEMLSGAGPYTVYAPDNSAMTAMGYATVEAINEADPAVLAAMLRYNIAADRRFVNDYILITGESATTTQGMIDNNSVKVTLIPNPQQPGAYTGITLKGAGNGTQVKLLRQDIITGNGVLHIADQVLRITQ
jgi:uncharacterized surface protein with fasciclin (FAS1) repeats